MCQARRWNRRRAAFGWVYKAGEIPLNASHMSQPLSEGDLNEIREEVFAGRKITAIKLYRQYVPGSGLAQAKDAVEAMERKLREESSEKFVVDEPEPGQQEAKSNKNGPGVKVGKGCFGVLVVLVLAAALTLILALWR
jgi:hypothetical protein